ncbi:MAG: aminotransferase class III-fold pyridoxal phosphate-dependent enzyme [Actinomycetota bacterium]|nr:aminotransferase class III-fold pyridoxal phosphate-dependent enzyme [Actinomycetota bacterium]
MGESEMGEGEQTRLWHPFADMGAVRGRELVIVRGEDVWVYDRDGRRYFDATASLWYSNIGHGRPEIAAAVAAQFQQIEAYSAFGDFVTPVARELAGTLADLAPMPSRIFLTTGGGEAIDSAAKIAVRYWSASGQSERTLLISRTAGYHGTNGFGTALGGIAANREGFGPQVETVQVPHDSLEALEDAIARAGAERVAAVFVEPVIGAGGVYPPLPGYISGVAEICRRTGALFVADAVICAFGRLGTWFGVERFGVEPDMITFAKGVTSGYLPLGGVVVSERVAEPFWSAPGGPMLRHGATYSAHAACCAAALANIGLLEREGLVGRGQELEGVLLDALAPLAADDRVGEVRGGVGTLAAVELSAELLSRRPGAVGEVVMAARERGVLVRGLGAGIAVSPPLTATPEHFALIHEAVSGAIAAL